MAPLSIKVTRVKTAFRKGQEFGDLVTEYKYKYEKAAA